MATTKEQAEAYDYEARRQATTLVSGQDEARTDPRRRINRVTAAGVLVGVLVMAGFGIAGFLGAGRGPALPESGAVLVAGQRRPVRRRRRSPPPGAQPGVGAAGRRRIGRAGPPGGARRAAPRPARRHPGGAGRPAGAGAAEHRAVDGLRRPLGRGDAAARGDGPRGGARTGRRGRRRRAGRARHRPRRHAVDAQPRQALPARRRAAQRVGQQRATPLALPAEILDLLPEGPPIAAPGIAGPGAPAAGVPRPGWSPTSCACRPAAACGRASPCCPTASCPSPSSPRRCWCRRDRTRSRPIPRRPPRPAAPAPRRSDDPGLAGGDPAARRPAARPAAVPVDHPWRPGRRRAVAGPDQPARRRAGARRAAVHTGQGDTPGVVDQVVVPRGAGALVRATTASGGDGALTLVTDSGQRFAVPTPGRGLPAAVRPGRRAVRSRAVRAPAARRAGAGPGGGGAGVHRPLR